MTITKQDLFQKKFRINSKEECEAFQQMAFELGIYWHGHNSTDRTIRNLGAYYISVYEDYGGVMTNGDSESQFRSNPLEEDFTINYTSSTKILFANKKGFIVMIQKDNLIISKNDIVIEIKLKTFSINSQKGVFRDIDDKTRLKLNKREMKLIREKIKCQI